MFTEPTELLLIGWLTELIWTPRFRSNTLTPKDTSHVTNGIIFFVCSTAAISALFGAPRISACFAASPKSWWKGCKNNQKRTGLWPNPGQRRWTWPVLLLQVHQTQITIPIPTQRRVLKDGKEMLNCSSAQGNLWQWWRLGRFRRFKT